MKIVLAALLAVQPLAQARAQSAESASAFASASLALPASFLFQRGAALEGQKPVEGRPLCEVKPLVAQPIPLPNEEAYFNSATVLETAGMRIHMTGSKDPFAKGLGAGWFFAFAVEGDPAIYWMPAERSRQDKMIHGHLFHAQVAVWGGITHNERIRIKVWDDAGFKRELTTGELAWNTFSAAPAVALNGKTYRFVYSRIIQERFGGVEPRMDHAVTLKSFEEYIEGGKTYERWDDDSLVFRAETLAEGYVARTLNRKVYGFRIKNAALEIADLTDYSGRNLPPCQ